MKIKFLSAVISAILLAFSGTCMNVFAEENTTKTAETTAVTTEIITEKSTEISDNEISEIVENTTEEALPEPTTIDYFGDDFYDTEGNASLIKSEKIIYNSEEMQFIAVTTKDGSVFYVLINYSAKSPENSVYFLNKVDAVNLYSLIYMTDEEEENGIDMDNVKKAQEVAEQVINEKKADRDNSEMTTEIVSEHEKTAENSANMNMIYLVLGAVILVIIGIFGFKFLKKPKEKIADDFDSEEEYNFYDDSENSENEE